jgi:L,D-transpeptidase catalytic domain
MKNMPTILLLIWILLFGCKSDVKFKPKDYSENHNEAKIYCEANNFNQSYYILIDLSIHSGNNRFFVYNFDSQKNDYEKLTTHGSCDIFEGNDTKWETAKFGSKVDSHCSMKGKYKIGSRDASKWGIKVKYWLHGLETSNANSIKRVTVLHSWEAVSDSEVYPTYSPLSWGCPAVSDAFMTILDTKLKISKKPVLLWIIE